MKVTGRSVAALGFVVWLGATTGACASRTGATGVPAVTGALPEVGSAGCALISGPGEPIATVALSERVDPAHAPHPSNDSERLLFRQVYETLVRVDCTGNAVPGLASSWRLDPDARTWTLTLREGARFSDGTSLTSADVLASWTRGGIGSALRPQVSRLVDSAVAIDGRTLTVTLRSRRTDLPIALAHTDLAIARPASDSPWPLGTRSLRITPERDGSIEIATADTGVSLRFLVAPGDPRDLLDKGTDVLLTRDPRTLDYAATLPPFQSVPLSWHRTHVLLAPGRARGAPLPPEEAREGLAKDAVRGEARGARAPFWWQMVADCEVKAPQLRDQAAATPRIVYDGGDPVARDLAERLVGLASTSVPGAAAILEALVPAGTGRAYQRATGITGEALASALRRGVDAAYVVALDQHPLDPCRELQSAIDGAPWLDPETIVPLADTRLQAIVRRGRSGMHVEWDGGLLLFESRVPSPGSRAK